MTEFGTSGVTGSVMITRIFSWAAAPVARPKATTPAATAGKANFVMLTNDFIENLPVEIGSGIIPHDDRTCPYPGHRLMRDISGLARAHDAQDREVVEELCG